MAHKCQRNAQRAKRPRHPVAEDILPVAMADTDFSAVFHVRIVAHIFGAGRQGRMLHAFSARKNPHGQEKIFHEGSGRNKGKGRSTNSIAPAFNAHGHAPEFTFADFGAVFPSDVGTLFGRDAFVAITLT